MNDLNTGDSVTVKANFEFQNGLFLEKDEPGIIARKPRKDKKEVAVLFREISGIYANATIWMPIESLEIN